VRVCHVGEQVREHFYTMLGTWLTRLPDRFDYEVQAARGLSPLSCCAPVTPLFQFVPRWCRHPVTAFGIPLLGCLLVGDSAACSRRVACLVWLRVSQNFLVPYLLSGMGDAAPHIATLCMSIIDTCGRMYEEEHADDVSVVCDHPTPRSPPASPARVLSLSARPAS
jgi:hypothetical protein